jgi:putative ABC transport system ATP-binding protein
VTAVLLAADDVRRRLGRTGDKFDVIIERLILARGDRVAMVGPSGCGKSTLLALLALALQPNTVGAFQLADTDVAALWRHRQLDALAAVRARAVGFVPQTGGLLPFLTLRANIALPLDLLRRPEPDRVEHLATVLDISSALDRRPADVSVGQRQRAAVARAVVHRPVLLLADEPTASVHPAQAEAILRLMVTAADQVDAALLIATHDPALATVGGLLTVPVRTIPNSSGSLFAWPC